jgi:nitroreductase
MNARIFPLLSWAGYLKGWGGPAAGERPAGYVILLGDTRISQSFETDAGIGAQTILLAATDAGLGGCVVGSVKREALAEILSLPEYLKILYVIGMGEPKEKVVLEPMPPDGSVYYWRDAEGVHHVPKRGLDEVLVGVFE